MPTIQPDIQQSQLADRVAETEAALARLTALQPRPHIEREPSPPPPLSQFALSISERHAAARQRRVDAAEVKRLAAEAAYLADSSRRERIAAERAKVLERSKRNSSNSSVNSAQ
jgi:alkylation response protein AidB-like acyl-CoA dehydrogenase